MCDCGKILIFKIHIPFKYFSLTFHTFYTMKYYNVTVNDKNISGYSGRLKKGGFNYV